MQLLHSLIDIVAIAREQSLSVRYSVLATSGLLVLAFAVDRERFRAQGATAWQ